MDSYLIEGNQIPNINVRRAMKYQGRIYCSPSVLANALQNKLRPVATVPIIEAGNPHRPMSKFSVGVFVTDQEKGDAVPVMVTEAWGPRPDTEKSIPWDVFGLDFRAYDAVIYLIENFIMANDREFQYGNAKIFKA